MLLQRTCGRGRRLQRRYCIDTKATTIEPGECPGDRYKTAECTKQIPCPEDDDLNEKPGQCEDVATDCSTKIVHLGGRNECRQKENATWSTENCKKTCQFCKRKFYLLILLMIIYITQRKKRFRFIKHAMYLMHYTPDPLPVGI